MSYVFEVVHQTWDEFPGNEIYANVGLAKYFGMDDYMESFEPDGVLTWESILKGFIVLYEDGLPTDVVIRARYVHGTENECSTS